MVNDKSKNKDNQKDREEYVYGYDRSVDDLKVIGQNDVGKKNNGSTDEKK
ncbi:hypothetical protein [Sporosarcina sp. G11-34]|nr:hypothetical protein [Sporosarcina sp. G11-34]MCZ2257808.1 hypothetical protein [Sporosarcina sp. G11-34]